MSNNYTLSVITPTAPLAMKDAPTLSVDLFNGILVINWTAPDDGYNPILRCIYKFDRGITFIDNRR